MAHQGTISPSPTTVQIHGHHYSSINFEQIVFYVEADKWCMHKSGKLNRDPLQDCFSKLYLSEILLWDSNRNYNEN